MKAWKAESDLRTASALMRDEIDAQGKAVIEFGLETPSNARMR
jgi:hypothetical protein